MKSFITAALLAAATGGVYGAIKSSEATRLTAAAATVQQVRNDIPPEYWTGAHCVLVMPDLKKAAFIIGGEYGKGVMSCRAGDQWSAPVFMQIAKGSWGFQAGVEEADLILLVMNESGVQKLLKNKVNLGADASIVAGPLGRRGGVSTDAMVTAEIVSYSRSRGLFGGVDLSGGVLRPDEDANTSVYGSGAAPTTILATRELSAPLEAAPFLTALRVTASAPSGRPSTSTAAPAASRTAAPTDEEIRARVIDIQQSIDRMLADTTPAVVGTSGGNDTTTGAVAVDRGRLMHVRQQLEALLATISRR